MTLHSESKRVFIYAAYLFLPLFAYANPVVPDLYGLYDERAFFYCAIISSGRVSCYPFIFQERDRLLACYTRIHCNKFNHISFYIFSWILFYVVCRVTTIDMRAYNVQMVLEKTQCEMFKS
jgi:hypothetical protein